MNSIRPRKQNLDALAISLLLLCCIFWGWQQVLVKATLPLIPPIMQVALRFVLATALLVLWCLAFKVALFERDGTLRPGLLAGCLFALEFVCIYIGLQHTSSSRLTVFLYTSPFVVALVLPRFVKSEGLRRAQWLGLGCAFVAVLFALPRDFQSGTWLGDGLALAAGAMWGLTTVIIRASGLAKIRAEKLLFYQLAVSSLILLPTSFLLGENWGQTFASMNGFAWGSLLIQAAVGGFASYLVWMWLLGHYPATRLSSFVFLTPVFALVFGAWWLGEPVTANLVAALVLVGIGIVLVNR